MVAMARHMAAMADHGSLCSTIRICVAFFLHPLQPASQVISLERPSARQQSFLTLQPMASFLSFCRSSISAAMDLTIFERDKSGYITRYLCCHFAAAKSGLCEDAPHVKHGRFTSPCSRSFRLLTATSQCINKIASCRAHGRPYCC